MKKLPDSIVIPLSYVLVPFVNAFFWWSKHIDGVDPKGGQVLYKHKTVNGINYNRRRGLRHIFNSRWKVVPRTVGSRDVTSMYPSVIQQRPRHDASFYGKINDGS